MNKIQKLILASLFAISTIIAISSPANAGHPMDDRYNGFELEVGIFIDDYYKRGVPAYENVDFCLTNEAKCLRIVDHRCGDNKFDVFISRDNGDMLLERIEQYERSPEFGELSIIVIGVRDEINIEEYYCVLYD
ncbi:MAG: hypothetical protein L3J15_07075 [Devosiaceae bacterium]|nr:hypothetical protein [Devosiaceae bacterium]